MAAATVPVCSQSLPVGRIELVRARQNLKTEFDADDVVHVGSPALRRGERRPEAPLPALGRAHGHLVLVPATLPSRNLQRV